MLAREMLQAVDGPGSVTEFAFAFGFGDMSHLSKDFSKTFGEAPSLVLGRRMTGQSTDG
jgi:transcriptional regulator GlxA family with amidase domain